MPKNKAINLLPQEEFNASTTGRILRWATGTFRIIVIATEMVVMGAFLSRFWLDAQNSNLNATIKIKSAQVTAQAATETEFRNVQSKLDIFDKISKGHQTTNLIKKITDNIPQDITLSRMFVTDGNIELRGSSLSGFNIAQFITNLQGASFKTAELQQVNTSITNPGQIDFVVNITY